MRRVERARRETNRGWFSTPRFEFFLDTSGDTTHARARLGLLSRPRIASLFARVASRTSHARAHRLVVRSPTRGSGRPLVKPPVFQDRKTMYKYSDTLGFDLAVVVFVVGVMPLAVFLMQSKRRLARATALALMFAAVAYVAVFEHYRLHRPEVTDLGLKRAVVPESVLDLSLIHI